MGGYLSSPNTDKISVDHTAAGVTYGASSMQGWRISQEDAHNCLPVFDEENKTSFFAVYDGHGGSEVAEYTAQHLPDFFKKLASYKEGHIKEALEEAFLAFDATLTQDEVVEKLKELAGVNMDEQDEEERAEEVKNLCEEASLPIEKLMERFGGGNPAIKKAKQEGNFQSPVIRPKKSNETNGDKENGDSEVVKKLTDLEKEDNDTKDVKESDNEVSTTSGDKVRSETSKNCEVECAAASSSSAGSSKTEDVHCEADSSSAEPSAAKVEKPESSTCKPGPSGDQPGSSDQPSSSASAESSSDQPGSSSDKPGSSSDKPGSSSDQPGSSSDQPGSSSDQPGSSSQAGSSSDQPSSSSGSRSSRAERRARRGPIPDSDEDESSMTEDDSSDADIDSDDSDAVKFKAEMGDAGSGEDDSEDDDDDELEEQNEEEEFEDVMTGGEEPGQDSGCTSVVAVCRGRQLYVANAGDSRCVVGRAGKAIEMSFDHKPEDELEKNRILAAGGWVSPDGRVKGGLNLSRAIGDHCYKLNTEKSDKEQMITALPDIKSLTLTDEDTFMVLACDGIWNVLDSQQVVTFIHDRLTGADDDAPETKLSAICEELFDICLAPDTRGDGTGCDNMTCIIVRFDDAAALAPKSGDKRPASQSEPAAEEGEQEEGSGPAAKRARTNGEPDKQPADSS